MLPCKSVKSWTQCRLYGSLSGIIDRCLHIIMLSLLVIWKREAALTARSMIFFFFDMFTHLLIKQCGQLAKDADFSSWEPIVCPPWGEQLVYLTWASLLFHVSCDGCGRYVWREHRKKYIKKKKLKRRRMKMDMDREGEAAGWLRGVKIARSKKVKAIRGEKSAAFVRGN